MPEEENHNLSENFTNLLENYDVTIGNVIQYMVNNSIFNTYLITCDDDSGLSIILRTVDKTKNILQHLGKYKRIAKNDDLVKNNENCPICYSEYKDGEYQRTLYKCHHIFHKKCIDKWLKINREDMTCPICRTNYNKTIVL